ncbi:TrkH family potassium uptake protein [Desulfurococcaceae archaeon MEX13E-LK6-19]|nr:TrkH family potassium uptake protein [Desulfurococcaceae archaeon MEX13E-LK6-19]
MNWRGILKSLMGLNGVLGILMLSVPIIDLMTGREVSYPFLIGSLIFVLMGLFSVKIEAESLSLIDGLMVVALAWPLISFEGAIVLMATINIPLVDAWFESISGFTGTGFTVLEGLDHMKPSIVTWRSIMQWSGELGFVVFAMVLLPYFYRISRAAYGLERPVKIEASFYKTAVSLIKIYVILTLVALISYIYTGMNFYEAFNHVLTTIATGGMSTYDKGYQVIFERAPLTYLPVMVFMFIGGMNFYLIARVFKGDLRSLLQSEEFKTYYVSMIVLVIALTVSYVFTEGMDVGRAVVEAPFNLVSGMTTTGFSIGKPLSELTDTSKAIIVASMFLGGMMFSTAGGIKAIRLLIILKKFKDMFVRSIVSIPIGRRLTIDGAPLHDEDVIQASLFIILHTAAVFIGAVLLSFYGYSFIDSLFEATSAAGCVGLSVGIVSPVAPLGVKIIIMILMILGRIEYTHLVLIFALIYGRKIIRAVR